MRNSAIVLVLTWSKVDPWMRRYPVQSLAAKTKHREHTLRAFPFLWQHKRYLRSFCLNNPISIGAATMTLPFDNRVPSPAVQTSARADRPRIGTLLRDLIDKSGYSINRLAGEAGVDRSSLTHVCNNKRLPSPEMIESVLPLLKVTPQERIEFYDLWERTKLGDGVWGNRRAFRKMVEDSAAYVHAEDSLASAPRYVRVTGPGEDNAERSSFEGLCRGANLLVQVLLDQILAEADKPHARVALMLPASSQLIETLIGYLLELEPQVLDRVNLRLLIPMSRVSSIYEQTEGTQQNIQSMTMLLPVFVRHSERISIAYYYLDGHSSVESASGPDQLFPYYLLTSQSATLISFVPQPVGYVARDIQLVDHAWYRFEDEWASALPLFETSLDIGYMIGRLNDAAAAETASWTIELQPCVSMNLTDEQIERYCRRELPQRELLVGIMQRRCRALRQQRGHVSIFSREGAERFMRDGMLGDIPQGAAYPITPEDRVRLVQGVIDSAKVGRVQLHMVNPAVFVVPGRMCVVVSDLPDLTVVGANTDGSFTYAHVMEPSLRDAAVDFARALSASPYVTTCEEAVAFLEGLLGQEG